MSMFVLLVRRFRLGVSYMLLLICGQSFKSLCAVLNVAPYKSANQLFPLFPLSSMSPEVEDCVPNGLDLSWWMCGQFQLCRTLTSLAVAIFSLTVFSCSLPRCARRLPALSRASAGLCNTGCCASLSQMLLRRRRRLRFLTGPDIITV